MYWSHALSSTVACICCNSGALVQNAIAPAALVFWAWCCTWARLDAALFESTLLVQADVGAAMAELGEEHVQEHSTKDALFSIDLALPGRVLWAFRSFFQSVVHAAAGNVQVIAAHRPAHSCKHACLDRLFAAR